MHDYVCFLAPIDYCVEKKSLMYQTFYENCSSSILKWFQPNSFAEVCFLEESSHFCVWCMTYVRSGWHVEFGPIRRTTILILQSLTWLTFASNTDKIFHVRNISGVVTFSEYILWLFIFLVKDMFVNKTHWCVENYIISGKMNRGKSS